ncbi:hypothetical protein GSY74_09985 [Sulfurovum sp. bin170]|uniref:plasminogen-binding N-terminal domain-containing protein n=1 Tax=Sulfurovum sp. bin170 TaxID=2695268 RepID=UPI0013DF416C|nr:plasminogen-binding N-terminal domain-containing protein [Sulfurovum sp. bin170]NEW61613.1 hypothetical protein [Sulfurovum sp. bin170]
MKKLLLIALTTLSLMAIELPKTIETTIQAINNGTVQLSKNIPKGMSGIVVHDYGNELSAITHTIVSQGDNQATLESYSILSHVKLPSIKTIAKKGDRVIFGNFYNNVLLIAPNGRSYREITKSIKKSWVHPDSYAMHLISNDEIHINLENLKAFAGKNQVGLVLVATKDSLLTLDPISGVYLGKEPLSLKVDNAQSPFYARFEQISTDIFSSEDTKKFEEYYKGIERLTK